MISEWIISFFRSMGGFLVLIGLLVTIHEFGHFYVARKLGFKVLKFSVGFGKSIWKRTGKDGIEYAVGLIPLGGYVALLDERVHTVGPEEMHLTFNAQALWKRTCVVVAGPLANIILAIFLFWGLYIYGLPMYKPYIDAPLPETPMAVAGFQKKDLVLSVDGHAVETYEQLIYRLIDDLGDGVAEIEVLRDQKVITKTLDLGAPLSLNAKSMLDKQLGLQLYMPDIPPRIGLVLEGSAAEHAGIKRDDLILTIDGKAIQSWYDVLSKINALKPETNVAIEVLRDQKHLSLNVIPALDPKDQKVRIGIGVADIPADILKQFKEMQTLQKYGPIAALGHAVKETVNGGLMIFKFIIRMIEGDIHINTMAGPISIANIAGQALESGFVFFVQLIALFSINIGVLNLLPFPVLDGGRLVGFLIEKIVGKDTIPERITLSVMKIGAYFLISFFLLVIYYDIARLFYEK